MKTTTRCWLARRRPGRLSQSTASVSFPARRRLRSTFPAPSPAEGFEELPITVNDAARAGSLPIPHNDPFDRMLIAQALTRDLVLVSIETRFDSYGVRRLW